MSDFQIEQDLFNYGGVRFEKPELLIQALTHKSYAHENSVDHNERLEFLGDILVNMFVSVELFRRYPEKSEGELSKMRSHLVDEQSLSQKAILLGLNQQIRLGRGEIKSSSFENPRLLASVFEALLAAIYLDQGLSACEKFLSHLFSEDLQMIQDFEKIDKDYKTQFQEMIQKKYQTTPMYKIIHSDSEGTEVEIYVQGQLIGLGQGKNRKQAEQNAAEKAMKKVKL